MSIITDFINRIRNRNQALPEPNQDARTIEQYDYQSVIDYIKSNGGIHDFYAEMDRINANKDEYYPSKVHGIEHTSRVTFFATILSKLDNLDDHTKKLLLTAARLHDVGRVDDRESKEHGSYGRDKIDREGLLDDFSRADKDIIKFVVEQHSLSKEENEQAINKQPFWRREKYAQVLSYLKDADALDRVRIANENMKLDPNRLRCDSAKRLVNFAYENYRNFFQIMQSYNERNFSLDDPILKNAYELVKDSLGLDWVKQNTEFLKNMYSKGILQHCKNENLYFLDVIEEPSMLSACNEVAFEDFEFLRESGYNITYQSFLEIVGQYKPGTLEILRNKGDLASLFSKETFEKYGKEPSFEDRLREEEISDKDLFNKINSSSSTKLMKETFEKDYMLYRNLYNNHKDAFDLFLYVDLDINFVSVCGILENIKLNDLDKLKNEGYKLSLKNLVEVSYNRTPEEYRKILDSVAVSELFEYDKRKDIDGREYKRVLEKITKMNPDITEDEFYANYELYKRLFQYNINVYELDELKEYSIKELYPALAKLVEVEDKLSTIQNKNIKYSNKDLLNLLKFSQTTKILESPDEVEVDSVIQLIINKKELTNDPRFIEYVTKKNKVFKAEKPEDVLDYNRFCMEKILDDPKLSLEEAKKLLINSLINIDAPKGEFKDELEENIIDELYYYKKYKENGDFDQVINPNERAEQEMMDTIDELIKTMDSQTMNDFRKNLWMMCYHRENINFNAIVDVTQDRMKVLAREDMVKQLKKTGEMIKSAPQMIVEHPNKNIPIKYLGGQDFVLTTTTSMPYCSSVSKKRFNMDPNLIKDNMLNRPLNPDNRCTSTVRSDKLAHAKSALQDSELVYAYISENSEDIGVMGKHDLSTVKRDVDGRVVRVTSKSTQNRKTKDLIDTGTEEHDEVVLNNVYPRYIVCFDKISDIALQKYEMLKEQYAKEGEGREIDIVFIDAKNKYLPQIEQNLADNMELIEHEIDETGQISKETMDKFFNKRERHLVLETVQAVNSTSYRDELWDPVKNKEKFDRLAEVMEKVANVVPHEKVGEVMSQVKFLLDKVNPENYKTKGRFYDHNFRDSVDTKRFEGIYETLENKLNSQFSQIKNQVKESEELEIDEQK